MLKLNGIQPLVNLLHSPNPQVKQTASAALRNMSFKSDSSKEAIHRCGGITEAVALLKDTDSEETQKHLTGTNQLGNRQTYPRGVVQCTHIQLTM